MELQAVLEDDRHPDDPTGGWIAATKRFGASVVSLDLDDDMMMMTAAGAREESASNTLALWSVEDLAGWLTTTMELPAVGSSAAESKLDGKVAELMDKQDWQELGAKGYQAARIVANLKSL